MEKQFLEKQEEILNNRLSIKEEKNIKYIDSGNILLNKCKSWGGPVTSITEVRKLAEPFLKKIETEQSFKSKLRAEILLRKHLSPSQVNLTPHLFKVNGLNISILKNNLMKLIENNSGKYY